MEIMKKDHFMGSKESVAMGLVDVVLEEPKEDEEDILDDATKEFVSSFTGHVRDQEYSMALYAKANSSDDIMQEIAKIVKPSDEQSKNISGLINKFKGLLGAIGTKEMEGDEDMDKDQMINSLKDEHGIDITAILADVDAKDAIIAEKDEAITSLEEELESASTTAATIEMDALLEQLITDSKATQSTNEINKIAFESMGLEAAKEHAAKMPVIAKIEKESVDVDDTTDLTDAEVEHEAIKALAAEKNISIAAAAKMHITKK
jgi:C4-type Zn-finger protein